MNFKVRISAGNILFCTSFHFRANPRSKIPGLSYSGLENITNTIAGGIEENGTSSAGLNVTDTSTDVEIYLLKIGISCVILALVLVLVILCWKFKDHQLMVIGCVMKFFLFSYFGFLAQLKNFPLIWRRHHYR